jgi:hypothetical protein
MYTLCIILLYFRTLNIILLPQMHLNATHFTHSVSQELSKLFLNSFIGIVTINFLFVKVYGAQRLCYLWKTKLDTGVLKISLRN